MGCDLVLIEWKGSRRPAPEWEWLDELDAGEAALRRPDGRLIHDQSGIKALAQKVGEAP